MLQKNGCQFRRCIFKCIFFNEESWISTDISLRYVPNGPIDKKSVLVLVMAWHLFGLTVTWTNVDQDLWHHIWHLRATLDLYWGSLDASCLFINPLAPWIIGCNSKFITFMPGAFTERKLTRWMLHYLIGQKSVWGSRNGLVPDGTKPIPESILTKFHGAIWFTRV